MKNSKSALANDVSFGERESNNVNKLTREAMYGKIKKPSNPNIALEPEDPYNDPSN